MTGFWKTWMNAWWLLMLGGVLVFWFAAFPGLDGAALLFYDAITWPIDGETGFTEATRPTAAVLGAVFLGFVLALGALMRMAYAASGEAAASLWRTITAIMLIWYLTDSAVSVLTGIPGNAVSNTGIIAGYLLPVLGSGALAPRPVSA